MKLALDSEHPLAVALKDSSFPGDEHWLIVKCPAGRETKFRACLTKWEIKNSDITTFEFETWEQYMERKAQLAGL